MWEKEKMLVTSIFSFFQHIFKNLLPQLVIAWYRLKFDENGLKFSKSVENTVRKGEIARYEQFLHFLQCL